MTSYLKEEMTPKTPKVKFIKPEALQKVGGFCLLDHKVKMA